MIFQVSPIVPANSSVWFLDLQRPSLHALLFIVWVHSLSIRGLLCDVGVVRTLFYSLLFRAWIDQVIIGPGSDESSSISGSGPSVLTHSFYHCFLLCFISLGCRNWPGRFGSRNGPPPSALRLLKLSLWAGCRSLGLVFQVRGLQSWIGSKIRFQRNRGSGKHRSVAKLTVALRILLSLLTADLEHLL